MSLNFYILENLDDEEQLRCFIELIYEDKIKEVYHEEMLTTYDFYTDLSNHTKENIYVSMIAIKTAEELIYKKNI